MSQTPQSLTDLFQQYLRRQVAAQTDGLGFPDRDGQVVPHESVPIQPVDPRLAWDDAIAVVRCYRGSEGPCPEARWEVPPDWPSLVAVQEPATALAFCIGNFPQMVRNLQPFLAGGDLTALRPQPALGNGKGRPTILSPTFLEWATAARNYPLLLVAAGVLRLARRFEEASELLKSKEGTQAEWQALRANEEAALAWQRGNAEEALESWQDQKTSVPVLFNRGMAALFLGRAAEARKALGRAVAQLPETSAWHHLGQLYLTLSAAEK